MKSIIRNNICVNKWNFLEAGEAYLANTNVSSVVSTLAADANASAADYNEIYLIYLLKDHTCY